MNIILLISLLSHPAFAVDRSPEQPSKKVNQKELLCNIEEKKKVPDFDVKTFIPLLENIYNTNQFEDNESKNKIYCILLSYYQKNDASYAKEFKNYQSETKCEN